MSPFQFTLLFILSMIGLSIQKGSIQGCVFTDDQGYQYDLAALDKPDGWQIKDEESGMGMFSMIYVFNFCNFNNIKCHDRQVGVYEALAVMGQVTENCDVVGSQETRTINHIDQTNPKSGLRVTFSLGDLCMDIAPEPFKQKDDKKQGMEPRSAIFEIECPANGHDDTTWQVIPGNDCIDQFHIKHSLGCKGGGAGSLITMYFLGSSSLTSILKYALIVFTFYMVAMFAYNKKNKGLEGMEAIPHLHVWQGISLILKDLGSTGCEKLKNQVQKIRGQGSGYNTV